MGDKIIVDWLRAKALAECDGPVTRWPRPFGFLWALFHPFKFGETHGRLMALTEAANAIEAGDIVGVKFDG